MKETDLDRLIRSIGKSTFVRFYEEFSDPTISDQEMVELLPAEYTLHSRRTRTTKARRILREGLEDDVLWLIANSDRVDAETAQKVRVLLKNAPVNRSEEELLAEIAAAEQKIADLKVRMASA